MNTLFLSCATVFAPPVPSKDKFLEAAVGLAQSLSQWDLLIIGGTLVILVGTSYYRPASMRVRRIYWLFVPAWVLLAFSIYNGSLIQRRYLAYLFLNPSSQDYEGTLKEILAHVNNEASWQLGTLEFALLCLGMWLLIYLVWWVCWKGETDDV